MGEPAAVMGDLIVGVCPAHVPAVPPPGPPPPLPFSAPLTIGVAATVTIGGRPAAVVGSSGLCTPPHVGLSPADPFFAPTLQLGRVVGGSATVIIEGRPAAKTGSPSVICAGVPGQLTGTATTVLIGE